MKKVTLHDAKVLAKKIKEDKKITHGQALNEIAGEQGFSSYQAFKAIREQEYVKNINDSLLSSVKFSLLKNNRVIEKYLFEISEFSNQYDLIEDEDLINELYEKCYEKANDLIAIIMNNVDCCWDISRDTPLFICEHIDVEIGTDELKENFYQNDLNRTYSYHLSIDLKDLEFTITKLAKEIIENGDDEFITYPNDGTETYFTFFLP